MFVSWRRAYSHSWGLKPREARIEWKKCECDTTACHAGETLHSREREGTLAKQRRERSSGKPGKRGLQEAIARLFLTSVHILTGHTE